MTFKIKQTEDLHFDNSGLIYEFPLWHDMLSTICTVISHMPVCILLYFYFPGQRLIVQASNTNKTKTAVRNKQLFIFSQLIGGECFPSPFNFLPYLCLLACQCWLSNKLMVCLITLWDIWQCTEGGPSKMLLWALKKMDHTNRSSSSQNGYVTWMYW